MSKHMASKKPPAQKKYDPPTLPEDMAAIGLTRDTALPVVDPITGEEMPIGDKKELSKLADENYEKYGKTLLFAQKFRHWIGVGIREAANLSTPKKTKAAEEKRKKALREVIEEARDRLKKLPFLSQFVENQRQEGLRQLGITANEHINEVVHQFFPGQEGLLRQTNEVEVCNDAAELALMAVDPSWSPRVRFEARQKLQFMEMYGYKAANTRARQENARALSTMIRFLNEEVIDLPEGAKKGDALSRYLHSYHYGAKRDHEAKRDKTEINDSPNIAKGARNARVTSLGMRRTIVSDIDGTERAIEFHAGLREKTDLSRVLKDLRYAGERDPDTDINGIQMIFNSENDWIDYWRMFTQKISNRVMEHLEIQLADVEDEKKRSEIEGRIAKIKSGDTRDVIMVEKQKGSLDGSKKFEGYSDASSRELKCYKFKLRVINSLEIEHLYEFQIFLPDGYSDYLYRDGVNWEEYQVNRFFKAGLAHAHRPEQIYEGVDYEAAQANATRHARNKLWGSGRAQANNKNGGRKDAKKRETQKKKAANGGGGW